MRYLNEIKVQNTKMRDFNIGGVLANERHDISRDK
jgi:hypothetical protein